MIIKCPVLIISLTAAAGMCCWQRPERNAIDWMLLAALLLAAFCMLLSDWIPNHQRLVRLMGLTNLLWMAKT